MRTGFRRGGACKMMVLSIGIGVIFASVFCLSLGRACTTRDVMDVQIAQMLKKRKLNNNPPRSTFEKMTDMIFEEGGDE